MISAGTARLRATTSSRNGRCRGLHNQVIQREYFKQEYEALQKGIKVSTSSKLASLFPELDSNGLIKSNGRLKYAEFFPYDPRFPVILPSEKPVTRLIVRSYHEENNNSACTNHLLSVLSRIFWVVCGREVIKECTSHYIICKKSKVAPASQLMALLPQIRLKFNIRAFSNVGIDFAGPFLTIQGGGKTQKILVSLYMFIIGSSSFGSYHR